jgi:antibiotic biosynthesis monooxygenase
MIARVLRVQVSPERLDAVVDAYREDVRPIHAQAAGLRQHYVLLNRETGWIEIVGVWDSPDDVARIAARLEPARRRLWEQFGTNPPLEVFDVADALVPNP